MAVLDINTNPTRRDLRWFGLLLPLFVAIVGAVVWRDGQVLLVRRANPPRRGEWSLPGGAQEIATGCVRLVQ